MTAPDAFPRDPQPQADKRIYGRVSLCEICLMVESIGDRIQNAEVTAEDLKKVLAAIDEMDAEDRNDFTGRTFAVMRAFGLLDEPPGQGDGEPLSDGKLSLINKMTSAQIRIEALDKVIEDPKFKAWSFEVKSDEGNYIMMREDVLEAAASTPLLQNKKGRGYFDIEEFFENLLSVSEEAGKG